jgi:hypothetical protein
MRKIQFVLLGLIIVGLALIFTQKYWLNGLVDLILKKNGEVVVANDPLNMTYQIDGQDFVLSAGHLDTKENKIMVFGKPVYGDLDQDGDADSVVLLSRQTGGSGNFFYVAVAVRAGRGYRATNAIFLGDRIAPQTINILDGEAVINYADRKIDESFAIPPSVGKSFWLKLDAKKFEITEVKK